jgi:hypothetical protein
MIKVGNSLGEGKTKKMAVCAPLPRKKYIGLKDLEVVGNEQ